MERRQRAYVEVMAMNQKIKIVLTLLVLAGIIVIFLIIPMMAAKR